jgi:CBS domain-containing protein
MTVRSTVKEFIDFLSGQPPFDALDGDDMGRLAARVEVECFPAGAVVVAEDENRLKHLWVLTRRRGENASPTAR